MSLESLAFQSSGTGRGPSSTAATTTGPASGPRPASSTPISQEKPRLFLRPSSKLWPSEGTLRGLVAGGGGGLGARLFAGLGLADGRGFGLGGLGLVVGGRVGGARLAGRLAFRRLGVAAIFLGQAGGPAGEIAQIIKAGAPHAARLDDVDLLDVRRGERERPLHAHAEGDLTHGEALGLARAAPADHGAFERLKALAVAFHDLDRHSDRVAGPKVRGAALLFRRFCHHTILLRVCFQQIGTLPARRFAGLPAPPVGDSLMIAREKDLGHLLAPPDARARVLRIVQQRLR